MYRAFISLYILIVASVVVTGIGLNALWGWFAPDEALTQSDKDLLAVIEQSFQPNDHGPAVSLDARISTYQLKDFASTQWEAQLRSGAPVIVHTQEGERQLYQRLGQGQSVVKISQPAEVKHRTTIRTLLVVVFYGAIAVVVFFWVWPLSRDLRQLESQTRLIGQDHLEHPVQIGPTSPVKTLASSFNRMSARVKALLASHKEMTSAVSHELRTPLARMKFALEMAKNTQDPKVLAQKLESVTEDVADMDALVNQLLAYAGFEHSSQALDQQRGDMGYLIEHLCSRANEGRQSAVNFEFQNQLTGKDVTCEWHLMERAIHNLVQNATRFAKTKVQIRLEGDAQVFRVIVADDGPGVAEDEQARVFESFVRLSNQANATNRGFGLGLAIVQRVACWHKGHVSVVNGALGGAEFCIEWPREGRE